MLARPPYVEPRRAETGRARWTISRSTWPAGSASMSGASTGGFTDCLLQRGAARVHAVDVGAGQLDWKLRTDPRVDGCTKASTRATCAPRNRRAGGPGRLRCELHLGDTDSAGGRAAVTRRRREMVILVKPQFEVGQGTGGQRRHRARPGIAPRRLRTGERRRASNSDSRPSIIESPILGAEGNKEFLSMPDH